MVDFDGNHHPHRRYNPLTGEHVLVSPHRTLRPWQGQVEPPSPPSVIQYDPKCYLCPGNTRSGGHINLDYNHTFTFLNDFPALLPFTDIIEPQAPHPLLQAAPVHGACDVLVFHPRHDLTLSRLPLTDIVRIITEWTAVYEKRGKQEGIKYVQIFENKGSMMGCSNPHPHGQVWSLSTVPSIPATELARFRDYAVSSPPLSDAPRSRNGRPNMLLEYAHFELGLESDDTRVVFKNSDWAAVVPWWAIWPFELLVLPYRRHVPSLCHLSLSEVESFAEMLSQVTIRYDNLFNTSFAYSMGIHQEPVPSYGEAEEQTDGHLHLHFTPPLLRSASVRKFLVGFELMGEPQRDLTAEQAAKRLRELSSVHYLLQEPGSRSD